MIRLDKPIIYNEEIQARAKLISNMIIKDFHLPGELVVIGVLRGSIFWLNDIVKHFPKSNYSGYTTFDFIQVSSYGGNTYSSENVKLIKDINEEIIDKNVLIIEDIIDTGFTMRFIVDHLMVRKPKKLKVCTMLNKPSRRKINIDADYVGFDIENVFVAGHGLDPSRELTDIYTCKEVSDEPE